ncbi:MULTISPECIES: hypothetical protein [unclassified Endozoicomonas]|uniref:hypothetical protein n=1 Tax=unclassified Endozoicomonas TaxID=2644528 RepID=UPI003BB5A9A1
MDRISSDLQKVKLWLSIHRGHGWSEGDNGMRLAMFGQLKLWAEDHFDISKWYPEGNQPAVFGDDRGWNMYKLAHRKARGDLVGDELNGNKGINYCSAKDTDLSQGDLLMSCLSYLSNYDLSDYFRQWNPSESKADLPDGSADYSGGLTDKGFSTVARMGLKKPEKSPLDYTSISG